MEKEKPDSEASVETMALLEGIKIIFPEESQQQREIEKIIHALAGQHNDEGVCRWVKLLFPYLNNYSSRDHLKELYCSLPQFREEKGLSYLTLPVSKQLILEKIAEHWRTRDHEQGKNMLRFFAAVHTPSRFIDDVINTQGKKDNPEEQKIVERLIQKCTNASFDWQNIEHLLKDFDLCLPERLYEILAHAWLRSGAIRRLKSLLRNDKVFEMFSNRELSGEEFDFLRKNACSSNELFLQANRLVNWIRNSIRSSTILDLSVKLTYEDLKKIRVGIDFGFAYDQSPQVVEAIITHIIPQWQADTESTLKRRITVVLCVFGSPNKLLLEQIFE